MSVEHSRSFPESIKNAARIGGAAFSLSVLSAPAAFGACIVYDDYAHHRNISAPNEQDYKDAKGRVLQYESGFSSLNPRGYAFGEPVQEPDPSDFNNAELQEAYQVIDQKNYYEQHHVDDRLLVALGSAIVIYELVVVGLMVSRVRRESTTLQTNASY